MVNKHEIELSKAIYELLEMDFQLNSAVTADANTDQPNWLTVKPVDSPTKLISANCKNLLVSVNISRTAV